MFHSLRVGALEGGGGSHGPSDQVLSLGDRGLGDRPGAQQRQDRRPAVGAAAGGHTAAQEGARGSARIVRESYHHTPGPQVDGGGTAQLLGVLVCWERHTPVLSEPWTDVRGAILLLGSSRLMGGTDPPF